MGILTKLDRWSPEGDLNQLYKNEPFAEACQAIIPYSAFLGNV